MVHGTRNLYHHFCRISPISGLSQPTMFRQSGTAGLDIGRCLSEQHSWTTASPHNNSRPLAPMRHVVGILLLLEKSAIMPLLKRVRLFRVMLLWILRSASCRQPLCKGRPPPLSSPNDTHCQNQSASQPAVLLLASGYFRVE